MGKSKYTKELKELTTKKNAHIRLYHLCQDCESKSLTLGAKEPLFSLQNCFIWFANFFWAQIPKNEKMSQKKVLKRPKTKNAKIGLRTFILR